MTYSCSTRLSAPLLLMVLCGACTSSTDLPIDAAVPIDAAREDAAVSGDAGTHPAACKIGDQVFPSGASGIKDPHSCNTCSCQDGQLACTEIGCPEECPPNSKAGTGCAACGPTDACEIVEYGCFPVCADTSDCATTGYALCLDNVCKNVCG